MDKNVERLSRIIEEVDSRNEYDIVEDLKSLEGLVGVIKTKDLRKKLKALIEKYETSEITEVRAALLEKCRAGDTNAIRLYIESFKPSAVEAEDDGLTAALMARGKEVFNDGN